MSDEYIQILDYGIGNVKSLKNALNKININNKLCDHIDLEDNKLRGLIIPGVGAFPTAINLLKQKNLFKKIQDYSKKNLPILGICLGMQILLKKGTEGENKDGLDFFNGQVLPLDQNKIKTPNIGWRKIIGQDEIIQNIENLDFYFVHSFYVEPENKKYVKYYIDYENFRIPAFIRKDKIFGFQFHPEKSGKNGLNLLERFCNFCFSI